MANLILNGLSAPLPLASCLLPLASCLLPLANAMGVALYVLEVG
ncbi:hypothetical protein [Moorena sp. SIO4A5]|nr:hypothetical protein [Moorena sp. SIO4A5]